MHVEALGALGHVLMTHADARCSQRAPYGLIRVEPGAFSTTITTQTNTNTSNDMGAAQSSNAAATTSNAVSEKAISEQRAVDELARRVSGVGLSGAPVSADGSLSLDSVKAWQEASKDVRFLFLSLKRMLCLSFKHAGRQASARTYYSCAQRHQICYRFTQCCCF